MAQVPPEKAEPPLVLAIDVGSSSVRVGLFDCQARAVAGLHARDEHPLHTSGEGAAIEEPAHLVQRVEALLDEVLARAGRLAGSVGAVRMDTFAGNYLGLDARNNPVTPIYTYADTRPAREVEELRRELDVADVYQRTGCPLHTSYLAPRIRWLQRSSPALAARVRQWVDVGTYLYRRWTGIANVPMSYSLASWSGMLEMRSLTWDEGLVRHLGLPQDALPDLDYAADVRGLAPAFAARWPALADVPFFLAVGDGAAANVGSGCVDSSRVALTVGTTGAMRVLLAGVPRSVPNGLWAYRLDARSTLLGGSLTEGGSVLRWLMETLNLQPLPDVVPQLARLQPDGHGLTVLPFLGGERSPGFATRATGAVIGLRLSTRPEEVLQASLEAIAYRFGLIYRLLESRLVGTSDAQVIASGGALVGSSYWLQVMADVLQRPVTVCDEPEATSRGTAVLALRALGVWQRLDDVPAALGETYHPDAERGKIYRAALERQAGLYDKLVARGDERP